MFCKDGLVCTAKGKRLDKIAKLYGLERKKSEFLFKENDKNLRKRIYDSLTKNINNPKAFYRYIGETDKEFRERISKSGGERLCGE
jgi:hypothetical protein